MAAAMLAALLFAGGRAAAPPDTREIAPGVYMPIITMGHPEKASIIPPGSCCGGGGAKPIPKCCDPASRDAALLWWESGGVSVETSIAYGTDKGVGLALAATNRTRASVFVQSMVPCRDTAAAVTQLIEQQLADLGTPYVDLLTIHTLYPPGTYPSTPPDLGCASEQNITATWQAFEAAKKAGKARSVGTAFVSPGSLATILALGGTPPAYNQYPFHVGIKDTAAINVTGARAFCAAHGITFSAFGSLRGGCMDLPEVKAAAAAHGVSAAQVCMRWVSQQGYNIVTSSTEQAYDVEDLASTSFDLSAAEMATLSAL